MLSRSTSDEISPLSPEAIERWLLDALASLLELDPQSIDPHQRFKSYGLDSTSSLRLVADLGKWLGRSLPATLFWDRPTIASVAAHLAGELTTGEAAVEEVAAIESTAAAIAVESTAAVAAESISHELAVTESVTHEITIPESIERSRGGGDPSEDPIAIIGMGCRFPGARDPDAFWRLLHDGVDAISEVPADRWDLGTYFDADVRVPGKMATRWGGFLERIDRFDAAFFGISPREALEMDPQQRIMLQVSWEALEDAGQPPLDLKGSRTGVFFGAIWNDYAALRQRGNSQYITIHTATGAHFSIISNRLSYVLGLQGPSVTVDTACSSSLVAIHLACQSLRTGESSMALAGGVTLIAAPESTIAMSKFGAMSPDGRSKAFDASANGYVRGEGAGVVVLKRLSRALACGDRVYAVIRGSAVNNDGFSNGLTAPNPEAQVQMLREAYRRAEIAPGLVQYIEAHGTGTPLGDPIEANALGAVMGADRSPDRPCRIGSVKTNIGHLEGAAGVAGLIKVLLAMKHGELPASLHFREPNPHIAFDELRLAVQRERTPWQTDGRPRLAGVSSFGFGGTNCHVVLEELPRPAAHVLPLAAKSADALETLARRADELLGEERSLEEVAAAAAAHASRGPYRLAVTAPSAADAKRALGQYLAGRPHQAVIQGAGTTEPRIVFVCSGQGSQWPGMGRGSLQWEPAFRAKVQECDEAMHRLLGWSVLEELTRTRPRSGLPAVEVAEPLLFVIQVAQAALWRSWGIEPCAVMGHGLGEVSAAHIAGILSLADAGRVICARSRLIREHTPGLGRLAVVELPAEDIPRIAAGIPERISIAAFNGPRSTIVGGSSAALGELMTRLAGREVPSRLVNIDHASHTRHMDFLRAPLLAELAGLRAGRPNIPMMSTVTASLLDSEHAGAEYWASREQQPVKFWHALVELVRQGHDTFVELGGHPVLAHAMKESLVHAGVSGCVVPSFRREEEVRTLVEGAGTLHAWGAPIRWSAVYPAPAERLFGAAAAPEAEPRAHLFTLSARDETALRALAEATLARIEQSGESIAGLCYTSNLRRSHLDARLAVRCRSVEDITARLRSFVQSASREGRPAATHRRPKVAFVFSGHGAQWWAMGRELMRDEAVFRRSIEATDEALRTWTEWSLYEELTRDEATSRIQEIDFAQPATFAIQVALAALWRSWGIAPDAVVGHSMGEVAAAHVAGAISLEDAIRITRHRSRLMKQVAGKGAMAVVELSREEAQRAIAGYEALLSVAGNNSPKACVLSGDPDALKEVLESLDRRGVFQRQLRIDVASHSPQMAPLRDELLGLLDGLAPRAGQIPIFSSVTAQVVPGESLDPEYWGRNLRDAFLFADTIVRMVESGYTLFLEISPHPILSGAIGEAQHVVGKDLVVLSSLKRETDERSTMLASLAALYERRFSPAWRRLHPQGGRLVQLPTYPWQEERFWPTEADLQPETKTDVREPAAHSPRRLSIAPLSLPRAGAALPEVWELELSLETRPYLADHVVQDEVTVPGAAQLEMALNAARRLFGKDIALTEVAFEKALFLPAGTTRTVQTAVAPALDGGHVFQLSSQEVGHEASSSWIRHVTGRIEAVQASTNERPDPASIAELQSGLTQLPTSTHYSSMEQLGFRIGPAFRGLEEFWRADGEVLALVSRPAVLAAESSTYVFHPALFDVAVQVALTAVPAAQRASMSGETFVLVGIGRFRMLAPLEDRSWCHVRLRPPAAADTDLVEADARIFDQAGQLLIEVGGIQLQRLGANLAASGEHDPAQWQYDLQWRPLDAVPMSARSHAGAVGTWIVLIDRGGFGRDLVASIEAGGGACLCIEAGDADTVRRELDEAIDRASSTVRGVIHLWGLDIPTQGPAVAAEIKRTCADLVGVVQQLTARKPRRPRLWVVTRSAQRVSPTAKRIACGQATLWGLGRAIDAEYAGVLGGLVDVGVDSADIQALYRELAGSGDETQVAFRSGKRFVLRFVRATVPPAGRFACRPDSTYLITGGLGGVGLEVASWLVQHGARRLVLLGRTAFPDRTRWDDVHPAPVRAKIAAVRALERAGAAVMIASADVGDPAQMRAAFEAIRMTCPPLRGIVHAAGTNAPQLISELTPAAISASLRAKVEGTLVLDELLRGIELDFLVLFSSIQSVIGMRGQASYAAANSFLDLYAHARRLAGHPALTVHWGMWGRVGWAAAGRDRQFLLTHGLLEMAPEKALEHLGALIEAGVPERIVSAIDWHVLRTAFVSTPARALYMMDIAVSPWKPVAPTSTSESFIGQLAKAPKEERAQMLAIHLQAMIAAVLRYPVEKLDINRALNTVGLDSILAAEVRNRIQFELGVRVQMLALLRGITTAELAAQVLDELSTAMETTAVTIADTSAGQTADTAAAWYAATTHTTAPVDRQRGGHATTALVPPDRGLARPTTAAPTPAGERPYRLRISAPGVLTNLGFQVVQRRKPPVGEVEIEVRATGLSFLDVLKALGQGPAQGSDELVFGLECAGTITAIGDGVEGLRIGDPVVAVAAGSLGSHAVTPAELVARKPASLGDEEAASIPIAFMTAHYALDRLARLRRGERVLIHSAAGGVGLAAVRLALRAGAEVFATAGTPEKRAYLQQLGVARVMDSRSLAFADEVLEHTEGVGVDIVINSLTGEGAKKSLSALGSYGRFVEIGKRDASSELALGTAPVRKGLSYFALDLPAMGADRPAQLGAVLREVMELVESGAIRPLPLTVFPMSRIAEAFQAMAQARHIGKLVARANAPDVMIESADAAAGPAVPATPSTSRPSRKRRRRSRGPADVTITPAQGHTRFEPFPLTDIQYAYWVGRQGVLPWGNIGTHIYVEVDGALEPERLQRAWQQMLARHEMLRTVILPLGEQQILETPPPYQIPVVDLGGMPILVQQAALERERRRMSTSIPPIDAWPHFEFLLHLLDGGRTRLHANLDMMLVDAFSVDLLFRDWGKFYEDPDQAVPPIAVSFRDYVLAEAAVMRESEAARRSEEYWAERMHTLAPPPQLPAHPAPNPEALAKPRFGHYLGSLEAKRWQALRTRATDAGLTPSSVMCAAFAEILSHWSKSPQFTINLTQFRRFPLHEDVNKIIGDFTSTILLQLDWSPDSTFLGRARKLTEQLWTDMDHTHVSGVRVLRDISKSRRSPLIMPVVFTSALGDLGPGMAWAGTMGYLITETSQVYLDNRIAESNGSLVYGWDVLEEYFPPGVLAAMFEAYEDLLRRLADGESETWGESPLSSIVEERRQQLTALNATGAPLTEDLLHRLGLASLRARPQHPAVITPSMTLSYDELFRRARQIAHRLRELGARPNTLVGVATEPSWERIVAALAVLESGAAYLPIDPTLPNERIAYLIEDGQVQLVLTQSWLDDGLAWPASVQRIRIDDPALANLDPGPLMPVQTPDDLAYVIFTSGSTGHPKGVMIDHRGAVNTIRDINERFKITAGDRVLALSNLSFDLSVYDVFGLLAAGGTIVIPDPALERDPSHWAKLVESHSVTIWNTVPQLMQMLVDCPGIGDGELSISSLRVAMLSGDWIPIELPQRIRSLVKELEVVSLGGATEGSIWSIIYPIGQVAPTWRSIPYGKPMVNQRFYVLNDRLEPCPTWVTGHLYIGGIGLAKGYWRDEVRTKASFITHPHTGERLYRTGDLGRYMEDNNIEFLGREDSQVKINGFRIELGEIEAALRQHPCVADCYVLARTWRNWTDASAPSKNTEVRNRFLLAYVVRHPEITFSEADIRSYLRQKLPDFMVPSRVLEIENVPLSGNGKVDRRALPDPDEMIRNTEALLGPRTDLERILVGMWSTMLGLAAEKIGVKDNFFDLGGNSLLLVKVSGMILKHFSIQLRVTQLFQSPTVESLAHLLDGIRGVGPQETEADPDDAHDRAARRKELRARLARQKSENET